MPRVVGLQSSNFDPGRYREAFGENHGDEITTDGLLSSVSAMRNATGDDLRLALRSSPLFVKASGG